ncbi:hypothetical protein HZZ02_17940, partial [Streptococcus danieliae]|nr:hypothetical protein [Streptococcus danieliae]
GLCDYHLPMGNDGLLGIIGTAGLWIALLLLILEFLPWAGRAIGTRRRTAMATH